MRSFFFSSSIVYGIYLFIYTFRWNGLFSSNFGVRVCASVSYATQAIGNAGEFSYRFVFVRVVKTYKNVFMFTFITSIPIWMAIWNEQNGKVMCVRACVRVCVLCWYRKTLALYTHALFGIEKPTIFASKQFSFTVVIVVAISFLLLLLLRLLRW